MPKNEQANDSYVFLRKSSGLVKIAGFWDVLIYNIGLISVGIGVAYTQRFGPAYYSGASIVTATLVATFLMIIIALAFWFWTQVIPRSGGVYVFLTRGGNPALGFALSFVECVSWLFYVGIAATLFTTVGLIPLFALLAGPESRVVMWLITPQAQLIVGTIIIWLPSVLLIAGTRKYFTVQKIVFVASMIGTLALLFVLFGTSAESIFQQNFNRLYSIMGAIPYDSVLANATSGGWEGNALTTFAKSIPLLVWPFLPLIGGAFSIVLSGEVQNSKRNQLLGMLGSILLASILFVVIAIGGDRAIGTHFQGAIAYNYDGNYTSSQQYATPFPPYFPYFAGLATESIALQIIIALGFMCWVYFWIPGVISYTERAFLAWSLDRVGPAILAKLHERRGTPYIAIIVASAVAQLFLVLYLFTEFFATLVFILAASIAWGITLFIGAFFPYKRSRIYQSSGLSNFKIGEIPLMTIVCLLGALGMAWVVYLLWNDSIAAGHSPKSLIAVGSVFLLGIIGFIIAKLIRRSEGISLDMAYKEIPVE